MKPRKIYLCKVYMKLLKSLGIVLKFKGGKVKSQNLPEGTVQELSDVQTQSERDHILIRM